MRFHDLKTLLDFHYWARDRVLDAVEGLTADQFARQLGSSFTSIRDTLAHIYGAEWVWYERWQGGSPTALPAPTQFPDVAALRAAWADHEAKVRAFLDGLGEAGIARVFEYKTFAGAGMTAVFWHMLQHVVNHGSYHRGQVTTMLRQLGMSAPTSTDLIVYYREHQS